MENNEKHEKKNDKCYVIANHFKTVHITEILKKPWHVNVNKTVNAYLMV